VRSRDVLEFNKAFRCTVQFDTGYMKLYLAIISQRFMKMRQAIGPMGGREVSEGGTSLAGTREARMDGEGGMLSNN